MKKNINLVFREKDKKIRVDIFIKSKEISLSRTSIKKIILNRKLKINGDINTNVSYKLKYGDVISLGVPEPDKILLKPYNYKLDIVYEDSDLLVINKSAGISIHPGAGNYDNTIVNALINYNKNNLSNVGNALRPGIVHRIDKDTSGLIVIAKNNKVHEDLSIQFRKHTIKRIYQALIWGKLKPQNGKIETLIKRSSKNRQKMEVGNLKGKKAVTKYKTLEVFENEKIPTFSLVKCELETGRTHQIRVHMSYKGNNILGDKKYKKKFKKFQNIDKNLETQLIKLDRQFLHAESLGFIHPINGKEIEFSSFLPQELENILKMLKKLNK